MRSPWGRVLRAIREDEAAAASLGKRPFVFRLQSFVIGSMLMGLGGAVYAHFVGYIAPEDFLQVVLIGVLIAFMLVLRPRGLIGEQIAVSRADP